MPILLHACCAPCSGPVLAQLMQEDDVIVFFSNANIFPESEYRRRRDELAAYCARLAVPFVEDAYDPEDWLTAVRGWENEPEKGARCAVCFQYRLARTARWARDHAIPRFTTTLTISPHKDSRLILALGAEVAAAENVSFLATDFKKKDGFSKSLFISRAENFYRQTYCGCRFSAIPG